MYLVFVCGGRDYRDRDVMWKMLDELRDQHQDMWILNGGARGQTTQPPGGPSNVTTSGTCR